MDVWIRWLGELFWRITKVAPSKEKLQAEPKSEEFWFRTYGIVMLLFGFLAAVLLSGWLKGFLTNVSSIVTNYPGADMSFAQPYVGAILALIVGLAAAIVFVAVTTFSVSLVLRLIFWVLLRWVKWYQERHPDKVKKATAIGFGVLALFLIAWLIIVIPNLKFPQPKGDGPPDPPKEETPPAA